MTQTQSGKKKNVLLNFRTAKRDRRDGRRRKKGKEMSEEECRRSPQVEESGSGHGRAFAASLHECGAAKDPVRFSLFG